jgi:hypothetical protein
MSKMLKSLLGQSNISSNTCNSSSSFNNRPPLLPSQLWVVHHPDQVSLAVLVVLKISPLLQPSVELSLSRDWVGWEVFDRPERRV